MGQRANFNRSKRKFKLNKNIIIAIIAIIIVFFLIYGFIIAYKNVTSGKTQIKAETKFAVDEYESLADLLYQYDCTYIREEQVDGILKIYVSFDRNLYSGTESNEARFMKIIKVVADYKNFIDFELKDTARDITISITADGEYINSIVINGDPNYYINQESKLNANKDKADDVLFTIQSNELQSLNDNGWMDSIDWGTQESTCDGYNIYFDEGIKYKKVAGKVFNVIFTTNYNNSVAGGLKPGATEEEIKNALGNPIFEQEKQLLGYRGEKNYLFFDLINEQISVYPVVKFENEEEFISLIEELNDSNDLKTFVDDLTDLYLDYDIYNYDSDYVDLQYTLLGINVDISMDSLKNGIYIYQNYKGNFDISDNENVYIKGTDLVFEEELNRATNEDLRRNQTGDTSFLEPGDISDKFIMYTRGTLISGENGYKGVTFLSKDEQYPDTELDRTLVVSSYKWYDDNNFVYSIDYDGIYVYNCSSRIGAQIKEFDDEIKINSIDGNTIIFNETQEIKVDIK